MKTRLPIALTACVLLTSGCALLRDILPGDRDAELQRQRQQRDELARRAADQERELARLHLLLLDRDAQIRRLESANTRQQRILQRSAQDLERVRARLQGLTGEAEAAAAIAETEAALNAYATAHQDPGGEALLAEARELLRDGESAFSQGDYAAAAGLADRAWQTVDNPGSSAVPADSNAPVTGPSEAAFSAAVAFRVRVDSHLRQGPGMQHGVGAVFKAGTRVTASGSAGQWVRVSGPDGRQGWIYRKLLEPPQ